MCSPQMSQGGSILSTSASPDLHVTCGGKQDVKDKVDTRAVTPTTGLARRASLADSCSQPDARCIL